MSSRDPYVIALVGDVDISKYPEMRSAFGDAMDAEGPVLIDLGGVHYVDSYFLSELLMFARKCEAMDRAIVVYSPDHYVARTFGLAGVGNRIDVFTDRSAALAALKRKDLA